MKFLLFSDLHHYPNVFDGGTREDLQLLQNRAEENGCDFMIHAGDFCHGPSEVPDYVAAYNEFHIPSYHCLGNHDTDRTPYEDTLKYYNMPDGHYFFDVKGYRIVVLNPNYFCLDGEYINYSMGNYYKHGALRDHLPPDQLSWLEKTVEQSPHPCILISHESFEREANGVKNQAAVREIINKANQKRPHSVLLCINGHYHRDHLRILDNVCYWDMNSASYDWLEKAHTCYPEDRCQQIRLLNHTAVYNEPLHAIVTVEGSTVTIEGMKGSFYLGVTREMTGNAPFDAAGRPCTPNVQSAKITL